MIPDVNVAIVRHREAMLQARKEHNPNAFIFAMYGLLGTLDRDLAPQILPRRQYEMVARGRQKMACKKCGEMIDFSVAEMGVGHQGLALRLSGFENHYKTVKCGKCQKIQKVDYVRDEIKDTPVDPAKQDCIPEPPPHRSISESIYYESEFWKWSELIIYVLEDRFRQFRAKYHQQGSGDISVGEVDDDAD